MWKKWIVDGVVCLSIVVVSVGAMWSLTKPGLPAFHDANSHIARMIAFHTALLDGQYPPMWAKEVLGGIGSPVMMLNYQLPYFIGETWIRLGLTYFDSYKLTLALSFVLSGLAMYAALRQKYKVLPAFIGTLVYLLAPYRMVDIYVRGAFGEALAFIFPPLILMGYYRKSTPWLTLGWAGLFLTHPLASAVFTVFFLGYSIFVVDKKEKLATLKRHGVVFLLAFAIAAFNLLPTLALTKYTYYTPADSGPLTQFPTLSQLFYSPWEYGISVPGPGDTMSFQVGAVQWSVIIAATIYCLYLGLRKKRFPELSYLVITLWISIFFMLEWSTPLYQLFHLTSIIDLPWRLLLAPVFASAILASILLTRLPKILGYVVLVIGAILLIYLIIPMTKTPSHYWHKSIQFFAYETGDSYGEYAPKYRSTRDSAPFWLRAETISGEAQVEMLQDKSNQQIYKVVASSPSIVRVNTSYFLGWEIRIDDKRIKLGEDCYITKRTQTDIDDSGLIACKINTGEHKLEVDYRAPAVQRVGNLITLVGIGIYLWILSASYYRHITKPKR